MGLMIESKLRILSFEWLNSNSQLKIQNSSRLTLYFLKQAWAFCRISDNVIDV